MQGLPTIRSATARRSGNFGIMIANVLSQPKMRKHITRISQSFNPYAAKVSYSSLMSSKRASAPSNLPPTTATLQQRSDSLLNLLRETSIAKSKKNNTSFNTYNGKKYSLLSIPQFDSVEYQKTLPALIKYLEEESKVFIPIVSTNKITIVNSISKFIDICDRNSISLVQTLTQIVNALTSNLFPYQKSHFREFDNLDALIPEPNQNWSVLNQMYKLLLQIAKEFPKLSIINMQLVNTLMEYSNSTDLNEKMAILDILQTYAQLHEERIPQLLKLISTKIQLILTADGNPTAASNLLNFLYFILSNKKEHLNDNTTINMLKTNIMPMIRIHFLPIFVLSYTRLITYLCQESNELKNYEIILISKYFPKTSGKNSVNFVQIIFSILNNTKHEAFEQVYMQIFPLLMRVIESNFGPAIECLLDQVNTTFSKDENADFKNLCIKTLFVPIKQISQTFFIDTVREKASKTILSLFSTYTLTDIARITGKKQHQLINFNHTKEIMKENLHKYDLWNVIFNSIETQDDSQLIKSKKEELEVMFPHTVKSNKRLRFVNTT